MGRDRNIPVHSHTTHTVCVSVCVRGSAYICVSTLAGLYVCERCGAGAAAADGATAASAISRKRKRTDEKKKEGEEEEDLKDLKDSVTRHLSLWRGLGTKRKK